MLAVAGPAGERREVEAGWVVGCGGVEDVGGTYATWFAENRVGVMLQRPDFHVFGTAPDLDGADALVGRLRSVLGGTRSG